MTRIPALLFILAGAAACTDPGPAGTAPDVVTETFGDTTVVRTLSGSVWGAEATLVPETTIGRLDGPEEYIFGRIRSIAVDDAWNVYVFDDQAYHVQVYDSAGVYVETLGGRGEGPGEFMYPEAIAILPDAGWSSVNPGNMRVQVFGPGRGELDEWGYNSGNHGSTEPLYTDGLGRTFVLARDMSRTDFVMQLIVLGPDGTPLDTIPEPSSGYEQATLTAEYTSEGGTGSASAPVPFSPRFVWTIHPNGRFLTGISSDYRIHLPQGDGVLRIERAQDPVAVSEGERDHQRGRITRSMRNTQPNWSWNGPPIPITSRSSRRCSQAGTDASGRCCPPRGRPPKTRTTTRTIRFRSPCSGTKRPATMSSSPMAPTSAS